jgi:hypothetical protein
MKYLLISYLLFISFAPYCQGEADKWVVSPNSFIDFSGGSAFLTSTTTNADFVESSTCISDKNGNLLFYSDGEVVWGANHNVLPNGLDLSPGNQNSLSTSTQGSIFVNSPKDTSEYYLFSLAFKGNYSKTLSYSKLNQTLNSGLGDVFSKKNVLISDTLSEKMAVTKHCNNKDFWLLVVKYKFLEPQNGKEYNLEFLSYLISENGVNSSPIRSKVQTVCPLLGQMKFNNAGDELAYAERNTLVTLSFNQSTGKVNLKKEISLPLGNGYGIEYSPNDSILYINEKQYNLYNNSLTSLLNYENPTQLQRSKDGKIYCFGYPKDEINVVNTSGYFANNWSISSNINTTTNLTSISQPNLNGSLSQYNQNVITISHPGNNRNYITLPYLASYHFNHKASDFAAHGSCINSPIDFYLTNGYTGVDSIHWVVFDLDLYDNSDTAVFSFPYSGNWTVESTVFQNGDTITSTQCVSICGEESLTLPEYVDLCETEPFEVNPLSPCASSYSWNTGDTTSSLFIENEGIYTIEMSTQCGVFSKTMEVVKSDVCTIQTEIPNIITANNDNLNDLFTIKYKNAVSFEYSILNRWGNLIEQGKEIVPESAVFNWNKSNLWNGTNQTGNQVGDGTYFYRITFETYNGSKEEKSGFIQVVQ